jgi:hypothetical protein
LLRKDRPWLVTAFGLGVVGITLALQEAHFGEMFVTASWRQQALFHVAWAMGLALGITAACFDAAMGMHDNLRQRPLSPATLFAARLLGCGAVLAGWFLFGPFCGYLLSAMVDRTWEWGHWQQFPGIWAVMTPAVSGCALGLAAMALPIVWWARVLWLPVLLVLAFSSVHCVAARRGDTGYLQTTDAVSWPAFVGSHLLVAVLAAGWAYGNRAVRHDADVPLPAWRRVLGIGPVVLSAVCGASVVLNVVEGKALEFLHLAYPVVIRHDDELRLATPGLHPVPFYLVDEEHRRTGEVSSIDRLVHRGGPMIDAHFLRLKPPSRPWRSALHRSGGHLRLDVDGSVWWYPSDGPWQRVPRPDGGARFAAGSVLLELGPKCFLAEPDGDAVWCFQDETVGFERWPLAASEPSVQIERWPSGRTVPPTLQLRDGEYLLLGETGAYALRDDKLVQVGPGRRSDSTQTGRFSPTSIREADGLGYTLVLPQGDGREPFRHRFEPRTGMERFWAVGTIAVTVLRPMVLLAAATVTPTDPAVTAAGMLGDGRWHWLLDPLVAGGRQPWLVALALVVNVLLARVVRRHLRRFGADAGTIRVWMIVTLLFGVVGVLCCAWFERPRMHARRTVAPAQAPRLQTTLVPMDVLP